MSPRSATRLAWGSCVLSGLLLLAAAVLLGLNSFRLDLFYGWEPAVGVAFPIVGSLIASRRPDNRLGWVMCAIGLAVGVEILLSEYVAWSVSAGRQGAPAVGWLAWVSEWLWVPPFGVVLTQFLLLFPDGRLPSSRWRAVVVVGLSGIGALTVYVALTPGPLVDFPGLSNPVDGPGPAAVRAVAGVGAVLVPGAALAGLGLPWCASVEPEASSASS